MNHLSAAAAKRRPWQLVYPALSLIYGCAVAARSALYDRAWLPCRAPPLPVICVGGLEAGGTGKTPMVAHLLARLERAGGKPGLLTRGYQRKARGLRVRAAGEAAAVYDLGDEAAMLVDGGLDVPVAACGSERLQGAQALQALGCRCAVMDDGLSHRALGRALNVVMVRGELPLRQARMLPWGSLREPISALRRADVIVVHHRANAPHTEDPKRLWAAFVRQQSMANPPVPCLFSCSGPPEVRDAEGRLTPVAGIRVVAAAGTARPYEIPRTLGALGAEVAAFLPFADHEPYDDRALRRINAALEQTRAQALVVTAKDRIKLKGRLGHPLWTLLSPLALHDPEDVLGGLLAQKGFLPTTQHIIR